MPSAPSRSSSAAARRLVVLHGTRAGDRLDAAHARRNTAFGHDREEADVARRAAMRAAAQLHAEAGNRDDAHAVAVLFAEERHRARRHRFLRRSLLGDDGRVAVNLLVDDLLDLENLLARRAATSARSRIAADRARPASPPASRAIPALCAAPHGADASPCGFCASHRASAASTSAVMMSRSCSVPLCQLNAVQPRHARRDARHAAHVRRCARCVRVELADVRHLSAGFDVERRLPERRVALGPFRQLLHLPPLLVEQRNHRRAFHRRRRVSLEAIAGRAQPCWDSSDAEDELLAFLALEGAFRARLFLLSLHRALEAFAIDGDVPLAGEILDEIERHAERVVQLERFVTRRSDGLATALRARQQVLEPGHSSPASTALNRSSSLRTTLTTVSRFERSSG